MSAPPSPKIVFLFLGKRRKATIILQKKKKKRQTARPKFRFEEKNRVNLMMRGGEFDEKGNVLTCMEHPSTP